MDEILKQIVELREILKSADLEDESRETAERNLEQLELAYDNLKAEQNESSNDDGDTDSEGAREVDFTPLITAFEEFGRNLVEGQKALAEKLDAVSDAVTASRSEASEESEEEETEQRNASSDEVVSELLDAKFKSLERLIADSVPNRRGYGPKNEGEEPELDEAARLMKAVEEHQDPEMRLRTLFKGAAGEI